MTFKEWLMLGIRLFKSRLIPRCMIREEIHFKHNHVLYVSQHYDDSVIEMWAYSAKEADRMTRVYLGKLVGNTWLQPDAMHTYEWEWDVKKSAIKLHQILLKEIDSKKKGIYPNRMAKLRGKKVWTREDYVEAGKLGQQKVREKHKKSSVQIRWEQARKLSTE